MQNWSSLSDWNLKKDYSDAILTSNSEPGVKIKEWIKPNLDLPHNENLDPNHVFLVVALLLFLAFVASAHREETTHWCRFVKKIWAQTWPCSQCVHDMLDYYVCILWMGKCSIKVHAFRWEILDPVKGSFLVWSLNLP